jgi:hypothetical protein
VDATTSTRRWAGRVGVALGAQPHLTGDLHAVLVAQVVPASVVEDLVAGDHLDDAGRVPQVEERHAAVIAPLGHPAREGDGLAGVVGTQGAGLMGAKHGRCPSRVVRMVAQVCRPLAVAASRRTAPGTAQW